MTDEKKKDKALNALKKKFNTGGRVNARRGGTQELQEQLRVDPKRSTKTAKTSEPKNPTQEGKASDLLKASSSSTYSNPEGQMEYSPIMSADVQQAQAVTSQSPRGAANIQQAQNASTAVMAQSAGTGTDFNIDVDLSGMPQRENYGRGKEGNDAYQTDLKAWQDSLGDTGSSGGGGGDSGGGSDAPPTSEELEEKKEELKQTQENYVAPKADVVKAGQAIDHDAIIQDAMDRQPLFSGEKKMDYSYDAATGEYVIDNAGWGFEGDARFKRLSPEEFYDKMGINPNKFMGDDPSLSTSEEDIQKLKTGEERVGIDDPTDVTAGTTTVEQGTAKTAADVEYGVPKGYSLTPNPDVGSGFDTAVMPSAGKVFAYNQETGQRIEIDEPGAKTITADVISDEDRTRAEAATDGTFDDAAKAGVATLTQGAEAVGRDAAQEKEALATAAQRPEAKDYAEGVTTDERFKVINAEDPVAASRIANTISNRKQKEILDIISEEGVDLEKIPEFALAKKREAQVGEAKTKVATQLGDAPSVDFEGREAITGTAPQGDASQIGGIPTMAASQMQAITGEARKAAAADMMAVVGNIPPEVTAAIAEDPATVEAQIDKGENLEVIAAVAALPEEALVSTQMENLLAGMEDGKTPAWARPAVAAIEQQMAQRGLSASTVGRDALFNAIIQSALPMAQSNAQALQQRAAQNLSNEQQANLASAQNTMTVRMANLSNKQTAASQTADMAQQIKVQQGQFKQQATITTADQQQQVRQQNVQNAQQQASQESSQRQQTALANLDAESRSDLANLEALNAAAGKNLDADQQARLAGYNAKISRIMRQAELDQDMEKANLDSSLRMELTNLSEQNAAAKDTMNSENQERLTNLQTLVDFKKTNASLAQQMDLANLNNEQQMEMANLAERAATDSANMTEANRMKLQEYVTYVDVMSKNEDLRLNAQTAKLSAKEKMSLANLTAQNQADSESMSAENMVELQKFEKKMSAAQTNAQLAQQMGLANLSNKQDAAMFNAQIDANMDMKQFDANQQTALANSQFMQTMTVKDFDNRQQAMMQNATANAAMDLANADAITKVNIENSKSFLAMDMANLSNEQQANMMNAQMDQQTLLSNQSATNASKQFNATSENQTNQFMATLGQNANQFNTSQQNAMTQFNAAEKNRMAAMDAGNALEADKFNTQIATQVDQFNSDQDFKAEQWNAANAQAVEQSNVTWRRNINTAETAAQNAANQQSASFQFDMDKTTQTQMWQNLRDDAAFNFQAGQSTIDRKVQILNSALSNAEFMTSKNSDAINKRNRLFELLGDIEGVSDVFGSGSNAGTAGGGGR